MCGDAIADCERAKLKMHLNAVIEQVWRCTLMPRLSMVRKASGRRYRVSMEMHLQAVIKGLWRWTLETVIDGGDRASLEIHLPGRDGLSLEMHLEAAMERVWRHNWGP